MNEHDTSRIADLLAVSSQLTQTEDPTAADLIVLNTCAVRAKATEKLFSDLGRFRLLKNQKPQLVLAVGGCVSMAEKTNIFRRAPYVDIIFGPSTLHRLPEMYQRAYNKERRIIDTASAAIEKFDYLPAPSVNGPTAYVSIIEGCNKFCSYCIVPFTRGIEASRKLPDLLLEINQLTNQGVKEIHLLGQNVNAYRDPASQSSLAKLVRAIAEIPAIKRIRFTTSHPKDFSDDLVSVFTDVPQVANHLHLPIQSGSDRILHLMRRGYTSAEYQKIIDKLRAVRPDISISTDFIVGFPTETAEDFSATMECVKNINFDNSFSFIYSPRPNTKAATMIDDVPLSHKKERLLILQNRLAMQGRKYSHQMIGTIQKVLVTAPAKKNPAEYSGRTENNRSVNFTAGQNVLSKMVEIKITEAWSNSLRGEMQNQEQNHDI